MFTLEIKKKNFKIFKQTNTSKKWERHQLNKEEFRKKSGTLINTFMNCFKLEIGVVETSQFHFKNMKSTDA